MEGGSLLEGKDASLDDVEAYSFDLPDDCLLHVFKYLDPRELCRRHSYVCRAWAEAIRSPLLWREFCRQEDFAVQRFEEGDAVNWKQNYIIIVAAGRWQRTADHADLEFDNDSRCVRYPLRGSVQTNEVVVRAERAVHSGKRQLYEIMFGVLLPQEGTLWARTLVSYVRSTCGTERPIRWALTARQRPSVAAIGLCTASCPASVQGLFDSFQRQAWYIDDALLVPGEAVEIQLDQELGAVQFFIRKRMVKQFRHSQLRRPVYLVCAMLCPGLVMDVRYAARGDSCFPYGPCTLKT